MYKERRVLNSIIVLMSSLLQGGLQKFVFKLILIIVYQLQIFGVFNFCFNNNNIFKNYQTTMWAASECMSEYMLRFISDMYQPNILGCYIILVVHKPYEWLGTRNGYKYISERWK